MDMRWIWAGVALVGLAGCDEVNVEDELTYAEMVDANADMAARVTDLPVTAEEDMPVTGSTTFDGYAALTMGTENTTSLVGNAEITADFADATMSGTLDGFQGQVDGSDVQELDGELVLSDGDIGIGTPAGFGVDVEGELTTDEDAVLGVNGTIAGSFRGEDGAEALSGVSAGGTDFTLDGEESPGFLTIVGER
jgi:hypothetical protein